jgi:hypothetical protein
MRITPKQSPSANYRSYSIGYESDCESESRTVSIDSSLTPRELRAIARTIELDVTSHWVPDDSQEQTTLEQENKELRKKTYSLHNEVRDKVATIRQTHQQVRILEDQNTSQAKTIAALVDEANKLRDELASLRTQHDDLRERLVQRNKEYAELLAVSNGFRDEVRSLRYSNTTSLDKPSLKESAVKSKESAVKSEGPVPERNYLSVDEQLRIKAAELGNSEPEAKRIYRFLSGQEDESALEHEVHILRNKVADLQYKLDTLTPSHYSFNMDNKD